MGLLYQLETETEREIPARLQASLQAALDVYRAHCSDCGLAMHRRHRYHRSIMTGYSEVELQIPVFRCGECRRMSSGMESLGDEERYRRYSKNCRYRAETGWSGVELRGGQRSGGRGEEQSLLLAAADAVAIAGVAGPSVGAGRPVDAHTGGPSRNEGGSG